MDSPPGEWHRQPASHQTRLGGQDELATPHSTHGNSWQREGGREGGGGGKKGGKERGRKGGKEGGREEGREEGRERGREGVREEKREEKREGRLRVVSFSGWCACVD